MPKKCEFRAVSAKNVLKIAQKTAPKNDKNYRKKLKNDTKMVIFGTFFAKNCFSCCKC